MRAWAIAAACPEFFCPSAFGDEGCGVVIIGLSTWCDCCGIPRVLDGHMDLMELEWKWKTKLRKYETLGQLIPSSEVCQTEARLRNRVALEKKVNGILCNCPALSNLHGYLALNEYHLY